MGEIRKIMSGIFQPSSNNMKLDEVIALLTRAKVKIGSGNVDVAFLVDVDGVMAEFGKIGNINFQLIGDIQRIEISLTGG